MEYLQDRVGIESYTRLASSEANHRLKEFAQHLVEAARGDCEGTPVTILEAGASGLPVMATRHAGIPDVVIEGRTGLMVAERDVDGLAEAMLRLAEDAQLAASLGKAARVRICEEFSAEKSIQRLGMILERSVANEKMEAVRKTFEVGAVLKG